MALTDDDDGGSGSTLRAWAQLPATQALAQQARDNIEARLLELVGAAANSSDPRCAFLAGRIGSNLDLLAKIARDESGKDLNPTLTVVFRKPR